MFEIARHYQFSLNLLLFNKTIEQLKVKSYEYEDYGHYFSAWAGLMQYMSSAGEIEHVIIESQNMAKEAERLNFEAGINVVLMTLGQALTHGGRVDEAIDVYHQILERNDINTNGKMRVHHRLAALYRDKKEYDKAIEHLDKRTAILDNQLSKTPENYQLRYRSFFLETEIAYCRIYAANNNVEMLKKHLDRASKHYYPQCFYAFGVGYHSFWGKYYHMTKQWDKCFEEYEKAINQIGRTSCRERVYVLV